MRITIYVEGQTEQGSLRDFFQRYLQSNNIQHIGIDIPPPSGSGFFQARYLKRVRTILDQPKNDVIAVLGLADFLKFPKLIECPKQHEDQATQIQWLKTELERAVDDSRFQMFFAVYEIEAWLLSQPAIFAASIASKLGSIPQPENIPEPYKFINDSYLSVTRKEYDKVIHGRSLFQKLDPTTASAKCPHLRMLLMSLATFAKLP